MHQYKRLNFVKEIKIGEALEYLTEQLKYVISKHYPTIHYPTILQKITTIRRKRQTKGKLFYYYYGAAQTYGVKK